MDTTDSKPTNKSMESDFRFRWVRYHLGCQNHETAPTTGRSSLSWQAIFEGLSSNQYDSPHLGDNFVVTIVELLTGDFLDRYGRDDHCSCVVVPVAVDFEKQ